MACEVAGGYDNSDLWAMGEKLSTSPSLFDGFNYFTAANNRIQAEVEPEDLPSIENNQTDVESKQSEQKEKPAPVLPNVLTNTLVARFKRVQVNGREERRQTFEPPQWLESCRPAKARGNLGRFVRYPDECYMFPEISVPGESSGAAPEDTLPISDSTGLVMADEHDGGQEHKVFHHSSNPNLSPTQEAIELARKMQRKTRTDTFSGIPRNTKTKEVKIKIISDERGRRPKRKSRRETTWGKTSSAPAGQSRVNTTREGDAKATKNTRTDPFSRVPGLYVFPKVRDFIKHERKNKLVGFDWNVRDEANATETSGSTGRFFRNMNRLTFPVTHALHREGTSVTKRKAEVFNKPGTFDVAKVWMRPASKFDLPSVMASKDIYVEPEEEFRLPTPPPPEKYPLDPWDAIDIQPSS